LPQVQRRNEKDKGTCRRVKEKMKKARTCRKYKGENEKTKELAASTRRK
jgi:hypothetical protein